MYVVAFFSIIALLLTYLESKGLLKGGMKWGFILMTFLGAIHYDYGNDYMPYYELANQATNYSFDLEKILAGDYYQDSGWIILCFLFKPLGGFFVMVAVLNIIQNGIVYKFIKNNVELKWWPFAIFIYLYVTSFYLMSFSMMRQMFVVIVFLGMWKYIIQRKWWIPLIVLYLCTSIHGSSMVLLPLAFWGFVPMNNAKYVGIGYAVLLVIMWLFQDMLNNIFQFAMTLDDGFSEYANRYGNDDIGLKLGLGFIINMIPFALSVIFLLSKKENYSFQTKSLVALGAISFLITPFGQIIRLVSRLGSYFGIFSLASLPLIYGNVKNKRVRLVLMSIYIFVTLFDYYLFFTDSVFSKAYTSFHTIFSRL